MNTYPRLVVDAAKLKINAEKVVARCTEVGVSVAGVVKVAAGNEMLSRVLADVGVAQIASSRMEQLTRIKNAFADNPLPLMLIRVPMISEAATLVRTAEYSLNSDIDVLRALNDAAGEADVVHKVILMIELGDLREGIWREEEYLSVAHEIEDKLAHLHLAGTGTNLGCYGSVMATPEKLGELVTATERIENAVGREMELLSGSASTAFTRVLEGTMPKRINHLRIGEAIFINRDNEDIYGLKIEGTHRDVMKLEAEIIEVRVKPTHPIGEIAYDAFRCKPVYEDRGERKRAIAAVGKVDYGYPDLLIPCNEGVSLIGASSDHTLLDIEDATGDIRAGSIVSFELEYGAAAMLTSAPGVAKIYR